jgi:hypothetical protein
MTYALDSDNLLFEGAREFFAKKESLAMLEKLYG